MLNLKQLKENLSFGYASRKEFVKAIGENLVILIMKINQTFEIASLLKFC